MNTEKKTIVDAQQNQWEVVSTYTDAQAVEDGVLVAVSGAHRVTRAAWEFIASRQPIDQAQIVPGKPEQTLRDWLTREFCVELINRDEGIARRVYDENIGGGIYCVWVDGRKLWLMPNENGGMSLMFPEDY